MVRSSYKAGEFYIKSMIESDRAASPSKLTSSWSIIIFSFIYSLQCALYVRSAGSVHVVDAHATCNMSENL